MYVFYCNIDITLVLNNKVLIESQNVVAIDLLTFDIILELLPHVYIFLVKIQISKQYVTKKNLYIVPVQIK